MRNRKQSAERTTHKLVKSEGEGLLHDLYNQLEREKSHYNWIDKFKNHFRKTRTERNIDTLIKMIEVKNMRRFNKFLKE